MDALDGVMILDLTRGVAGPLGVLQLAEHGADVIKVEPPGGDPGRDRPEQRVWNRSKRSITLDLKAESGQEQFRALAARADVVVESFAPGTMQRLGLDYAALAPTCPRLVYLSVPAYPSASRHASRPGWDALVQARSGLQYEQPGWREGPIFLHSPLPSMAAAYLVPIGILAALSAREETGRGQYVETSLYQGAMALTTMLWVNAEHGQRESQHIMEKAYPPGVHQRSVYQVADGWVHLAHGRSTGRSLQEILGVAPDADPAAVTAAFARQSRDKLVDEMHANGLGVEAIVSMGEVLHHEQLRATGSVVEVDDPEVGPTTQLGITVRLVDTPGRVVGPRPAAGAHTSEVLASLTTTRHRHRVQPTTAAPAHAHALGDIRVLDFGARSPGRSRR